MEEPLLLYDKYVQFVIDEDFASKHGETIYNILNGRGFKATVIDELCDIASKKFDIEFDNDGSELHGFYPYGDKAVIILKKKSNIIYLENNYIEEEEIISGWQSIFEEHEDKIFMGLMAVDKRREEIERLKTDREYMRQYLINLDIL